MATKTETNAVNVLELLGSFEKAPNDPHRGHYSFDGPSLSKQSGLGPNELNDAVDLLDQRGALERIDSLGTSPYEFSQVELSSRGRLLLEKVLEARESGSAAGTGAAGGGPSPVHQTYNTTIVGGQANIGGLGPQSISGANNARVGDQRTGADDETIRALLQQLREASHGLGEDDQEEASAALQRVETQLRNKTPDLERVKSYLDIAGKLVKLIPVAQQLYEHIAKFFG